MEITREFLSTVYIVRGGQVLLTWNKKINAFIPIGGHIDGNELPDEAVKREAKEESGFDIEVIDLNGGLHDDIEYPSGAKRRDLPTNFNIGLDIIKPDHHHINISYLGKIVGGGMLAESDEGTKLKFFSKEELNIHDDVLENVKKDALRAIEVFESLGL